jgi:hypothetical protein
MINMKVTFHVKELVSAMANTQTGGPPHFQPSTTNLLVPSICIGCFLCLQLGDAPCHGPIDANMEQKLLVAIACLVILDNLHDFRLAYLWLLELGAVQLVGCQCMCSGKGCRVLAAPFSIIH